MKKDLFILIACFLCFGLNAQNNHKSNYISSNACLPDSSALFVLAADPNLDSIYYDKIMRYFYTYDANGNTINILAMDKPDGITWVIDHRFVKTYNTTNHLTDSLFQWWNTSSSQWVNGNRQIISYNPANKPVMALNQMWSVNAASWNDYTRTLNYYDVSNKQIASKLQYWNSNNSTWTTDDSVHYVYNSGQRIVAHQYYKTNYAAMPYVLTYAGKDTVIYNSTNDPVSYFKRVAIAPTALPNSDSISWVYDAGHRLIFKDVLHKNGPSQWQNLNTDFYSYDPNNRMIIDSSYAGGTLRYYNTCAVPGFKELEKEEVLIVYPNPANSFLSISTKTEYQRMEIINLIGERVKTVENKPAPISVSDLPNGVYFIRILDKNDQVLKTEKFIKG